MPWPCGIYISTTEFQLRPPDRSHVAYIESPDLTLAGSRNAHSAIALWTYISTLSYDEHARRAVEVLRMVLHVELKLNELEAEIKTDLWIMHLQFSLAVVFKRPNERIQGNIVSVEVDCLLKDSGGSLSTSTP